MFSELLKTLRIKKGITQGELADAVGVSPGNVGDWERGRNKPGYVALVSLARFFEVSADELLELDKPLHTSGKSVGVRAGQGLRSGQAVTAEPRDREPVVCDGVTLSETEADLVAMYRILDARDKEHAFDMVTLLYEKATGEKASVYSTYTDTNERRDGRIESPVEDEKTGTA